jgi:hypothetical protein
MRTDFDNVPKPIVDELVRILEATAARLRVIVLEPPGRTANAALYNQSRAAQQLAKVNELLLAAKKHVATWTSKAMETAFTTGIQTAAKQLRDCGIEVAGDVLKGSFSLVNTNALEVFARDTAIKLYGAIEATGQKATRTLRQMAAEGVSEQQVNEILAGRAIIQGDRPAAGRQLAELLRDVHGETVVVPCKDGSVRNYDPKDYGQMVARTRVAEAMVTARHEQLQAHGVDLVIIIGRVSENWCTGFLGKVFSISGNDPDYPALDDLPQGKPPFHPNCSKGTAPFIRGLVGTRQAKAAGPDDQLDMMLEAKSQKEMQRVFDESHAAGAAEQRARSIVEEIRARAKANGYTPPPNGLVREEGR